ncbi:restriction endonuclease subunit S [Polaribacter filamentus]|uniref:restriction endonuclease subunit S n=1 Tax=Polaribacter filamentus TaxID=53483 RepID=UPI000CF27A65|nr:restriction endonuclease subunit S [Polaribacter filamentus]
MFQYVKDSSDIFRFDSTFFKRVYLNDENLIRNKNYKTLIELENSILSFGAYSLNNHVTYLEEGIPFIRGINMKNGRIDFSNTIYIDKQANDLLWKSEVKPSTVLLSMSGTIGDVAIASKNWKYPINSNQDIAKIHPNKNISSYYLYVFLLTKYGQNYLKREQRGSVQQHVFLSQIEKFEIPILKDRFISKIEELIIKSEHSIEESKQTYGQAENILLDEIGLQSFILSKDPVNIKSFKNSFVTSGRLDAEYYQLKYEQVVNKVKTKPYDTLENLVEIDKSIEPGSKNYVENGLPFMRVADLSKNGLSEPQKYISKYFIKENQDKINDLKPKKGTILFSKDGSVGIAYHLRKNYNGITSSAILHLKVKDKSKIIPEYLTLALNSKVVQMQAERDAGGSIILHWRVGEIENVVVPIIDFGKQQQIANLIEQSFSLKKQSEHLLEVAKTAVEIVIEENEQIAFKYINNQLNTNG